jgi:butyrate kinase
MIDRHESCLIFDPRKAIIPLSVAEQISLLKQGKPISSTSFYSSQNLTDFQAQFESFNERKENIESRIKTLKHELETFNNPDALLKEARLT